MKKQTIAIAGSIAALGFAAAPVTALAATHANPRPASELRLDHSRDAKGLRHVEKSIDKSKDRVDRSRDLRNR